MSATVLYEIARYEGHKADAVLLERLQLIAEGGVLRLRETDGDETPCEETDIASVISSIPALRQVLERQQVRITCGEDVLGQLPFLLEPIPDGASLFVNDEAWDAFPTVEGNKIMLPGYCHSDSAPDMNPCWAEYSCAEGDREDPLVGYSSIGLLTTGVAVEHGHVSHGGNGGPSAVSISTFDNFAEIFIDWLLRTPILSRFWYSYGDITSPGVDLFGEAAVAQDHHGYWEEDHSSYQEDTQTGEDGTNQDGSWGDEGSFACRSLELHLSQELIDEVRASLSATDPRYAAVLDMPGTSSAAPNPFVSEAYQAPTAEGFVGEVGEHVRNLVITNVTVCPLSASTFLVGGRDPSNHLVKWLTRSKIDPATESITFSVATVKAHESYTGTDKTVVTAAKVAAYIVREN